MFLESAKFALDSQWIDCNEDLPCNHEELIYRLGTNFYTDDLLIRLVNKETELYVYDLNGMYGRSLDKMEWNVHPSFTVIHWMLLPKLEDIKTL